MEASLYVATPALLLREHYVTLLCKCCSQFSVNENTIKATLTTAGLNRFLSLMREDGMRWRRGYDKIYATKDTDYELTLLVGSPDGNVKWVLEEINKRFVERNANG